MARLHPIFSLKSSLFLSGISVATLTVKGKPKLERMEQRLAAQGRFRENWRITRWLKMIETFSKY